MLYKSFKRWLDLLASAVLILFLSPLLISVGLMIKIGSRGPIFFVQERIGINKIHFSMLKFRTMKQDTPSDVPTHLLINPEKHVTNVGKYLRMTSLDELPQLFNILKGDMSLVGPRPALWNQYDLIAERDRYKANDIRPGITGWAQINGRDELSIEEKARLDGVYAQKMSFLFDVKCLLGTLFAVFKLPGFVEGETSKFNQNKIDQEVHRDS